MKILSLTITVREEKTRVKFIPNDGSPEAIRVKGWIKQFTAWPPTQSLADLIVRYGMGDKEVDPQEINDLSKILGPVSVETRRGKRNLKQFLAEAYPWNYD